ncbi:MAG: hypothetical protein N2Z74_01875 [Syntrophales bacterium]|nr:hypothetical protein [Syntrophales bacterium]
MDKVMQLYHEYADKIMTWYEGLTFVEQFFTLFGLFIGLFVIVALYFIKRAGS